jgi:hypothetical protein
MLDGVITYKELVNAHSLANCASNSSSSIVVAETSCFFFFFFLGHVEGS